MQAETVKPILKELTTNEKRKVMEWLQLQLNAPIKKENKQLQQILIKHISK